MEDNAPKLDIVNLEEAVANHPTAKEVHINEAGEWLFSPAEGIHKSFGKFKTVPCSSIAAKNNLSDVKTGKKK